MNSCISLLYSNSADIIILIRYDEHAAIDLPAMVNYVLDTSKQSDLFYVGHSQGTVMGFAGFTINQTLAKQIKTFFALAPVTTLSHIQGLFHVLANPLIYPELEVLVLYQLLHAYNYIPLPVHTVFAGAYWYWWIFW